MKETTNNSVGIAAGTVQGREHARAGRNNQDAFAVEIRGDVYVAIVCDGCGSAPHSEMGAKLISRWLAGTLVQQEWTNDKGQVNLAVARSMLIQYLSVVADGMGDRAQVAHDYFLSTIVGTVICGEKVWVFGIGDGVILLDGKKTCLEFPGNAPPYLAHELMGQESCEFELYLTPGSSRAKRILIASDGAEEIDRLAEESVPGTAKRMGGLGQFVEDDVYFRSAPALQRRLRLMNRTAVDSHVGVKIPGRLGDDTTIIAIRR